MNSMPKQKTDSPPNRLTSNYHHEGLTHNKGTNELMMSIIKRWHGILFTICNKTVTHWIYKSIYLRKINMFPKGKLIILTVHLNIWTKTFTITVLE